MVKTIFQIMKNFKFQYLFLFLVVGLLFVGCKDKEDPTDPTNSIDIQIEEPMNGENIAMANCAAVHIHIDFVATIENHEVEVMLHPEGDVSDMIINFDEHTHDKTFLFEHEVDLCSYAAGTCFHLEVAACIDHDCVDKATDEVEFCIQ